MPFAPGTAGTLVGIPVYLMFSRQSFFIHLALVAVFTFVAWYVSHEGEKIFGEKDSPRIVVDEIAGFQWTMILVTPTVLHIFLGFIIFRLFDIVKVFPAGYFQRNLPGGSGIVVDDVVAGIYSNVTLLLMIKFWGI